MCRRSSARCASRRTGRRRRSGTGSTGAASGWPALPVSCRCRPRAGPPATIASRATSSTQYPDASSGLEPRRELDDADLVGEPVEVREVEHRRGRGRVTRGVPWPPASGDTSRTRLASRAATAGQVQPCRARLGHRLGAAQRRPSPSRSLISAASAASSPQAHPSGPAGEHVLRVAVGGRHGGQAGAERERQRARADLLRRPVRRHEQRAGVQDRATTRRVPGRRRRSARCRPARAAGLRRAGCSR